MLTRTTSAELTEWAAYYGLEPWGAEREDVRALYGANAAVAPWQKGGGKLEPGKFFPHLFRREEDQDPEQMANMLRLFCQTHDGEVK